jgi:hypothetical protein
MGTDPLVCRNLPHPHLPNVHDLTRDRDHWLTEAARWRGLFERAARELARSHGLTPEQEYVRWGLEPPTWRAQETPGASETSPGYTEPPLPVFSAEEAAA